MKENRTQIVLEHVKFGGTQFEGSLTGSGELPTVDTPYGKLSAVICWDADFPSMIRQAGQQNVDLPFVPSNDWHAVKDIHAGMATFPPVEKGMSIFDNNAITLHDYPFCKVRKSESTV